MKRCFSARLAQIFSLAIACSATLSLMMISAGPPVTPKAVTQDAPLQTSLPHQTSWIGNTYGGRDGKWVQNQVDEIEVSPDGTVYAASEWDKAGRCTGVYKNGDIVPGMLKQFTDAGGHKACGWGTANQAIAIDAERIYLINPGQLAAFQSRRSSIH